MSSLSNLSINPVIHESWLRILKDEFSAPYFIELKRFLIGEKARYTVYPPGKLIFAAFDNTPFEEVRVVILGQDPYHGAGQAHGLCFSVPDGIPKPPSLQNIFKELSQETGIPEPFTGNLTSWARQGVLLLNTTLTVRANQAASHHGKGWEIFTDSVIRLLSELCDNLVFMLWGNPAQMKTPLIDTSKHLVLKAPHPSPLSAHRGFFGCGHFSEANRYLSEKGKLLIKW